MKIKKINKWRTSHGFGVHSPFAYRLITNVLRGRLPYYAFDLLPEICPDLHRRQAETLFRIIVHFAPRSIYASTASLRALARCAAPRAAIAASASEADMALISSPEELQMLPEVVCLLGDAREMSGDIACRMTWGMTFTGSRLTLIVNSPRLPRQDYRLWF